MKKLVLNNPVCSENSPIVLLNNDFEMCLEAYDYITIKCKSLQEAYENCEYSDWYWHLFCYLILKKDYNYETFLHNKITEYGDEDFKKLTNKQVSERCNQWFNEWKEWVLKELPWTKMSKLLLKGGFIKYEE